MDPGSIAEVVAKATKDERLLEEIKAGMIFMDEINSMHCIDPPFLIRLAESLWLRRAVPALCCQPLRKDSNACIA